MTNVLPEQQKKILKKEYQVRLMSAYFFLISVLAILASVLLFPTYMLSSSKEKFLENELNIFDKQNPELALDDLQKVISEINTNLAILDSGNSVDTEVSRSVIDKFLNVPKEQIKVSRIFYTKINQDEQNLEISGVASSRTTLNFFKNSLEKSNLYEDVNLPVSNFVKPKDIEFNIKLKLK